MIYADFNGSAPLCQDVIDYLKNRLDNGPYANPNAIHHLGQKALMGMENARALAAKKLGALPKQVIFNSGSTEGISQIFFSLLYKPKFKKNHIIISGIEHSAVINNAKFYAENEGYELHILPTLENGVADLNALKNLLEKHKEDVALVSVMAANNETGVIQPFKEIGELCNKHHTPFVCDTTQYIGKAPFNFSESNIDYALLSGHKIGAMTGAGFVLARDPNLLKTLVIGGGQERGLRGGTQNYIGFETIAVALNTMDKKLPELEKLASMRNQFEKKIKENYPKVVIMGEDAPRMSGTTFLAYPGIHGQAVQIELESQDIYVTTSSACSDNEPTTSKVLKAMGVTDDIGRGAVRISLGPCANQETYDKIYHALESAFNKLSQIKSY
ncbi:MAG: cysteine desulfurase [Halobacteriovoraceae bacterium]|nr:cysteine desulfurase [Halobacteriovoraceae bacterium]